MSTEAEENSRRLLLALDVPAKGAAEAGKEHTFQGPNGKPVKLTSKELAQMDNAMLLMLREANPAAHAQAVLAPFEHRAFAREEVRERPLMALPIALATPLYAAAKAMGLMGARTRPTMEQVKQGLTGVGEGLTGGGNR